MTKGLEDEIQVPPKISHFNLPDPDNSIESALSILANAEEQTSSALATTFPWNSNHLLPLQICNSEEVNNQNLDN